jgi:hypothetical protein
MKIYINQKIINTKEFQSINSIIDQYLIENNINDTTNNYYATYNGKYLNRSFSLEKYDIKNDNIILYC